MTEIPSPQPAPNDKETPVPPDMNLIEAEMAQAAERARWREINELADKADEAESTENDPLARRLRGRADFLRNRGEVKTPELLEAAADALESAAEGRGARDSDTQLMNFYSVETLHDLVSAQERHIVRLQAKLPTIDQPAFTRVREG